MKEPLSKFLVESGGGPGPRAMGDADLFTPNCLRDWIRGFELFCGQKIEMGPPQDCVKFLFLHFMDHVIDDIDHPGMGATEDQDEALSVSRMRDWSSGKVFAEIFPSISVKSLGWGFQSRFAGALLPLRTRRYRSQQNPNSTGTGLEAFPSNSSCKGFPHIVLLLYPFPQLRRLDREDVRMAMNIHIFPQFEDIRESSDMVIMSMA